MTDQALQEAFSVCGEVNSGVVITRGTRSLGYGFVEFNSPESALSSVDKMNSRELFGRQIKVELAKDPSERVPHSPNTVNRPPRDNLAPRPPREVGGSSRFRGNNKTPSNADEETEQQRGSGGKGRQMRSRNQHHSDVPKADKIPSKTTLFVANLPFSVDDGQLKEIFAGTKVKNARVVHTKNGRTRGYGFVEFDNEADQLAALESKNNLEVSGANNSTRTITVSISDSAYAVPEENVEKQ